MLFGAVALVGVIEAVGGVGLHQRRAIHAGPVHLRDQVLDVVADLSGPSPCAGVEWVLDFVAADHVGMGVDDHGRRSSTDGIEQPW